MQKGDRAPGKTDTSPGKPAVCLSEGSSQNRADVGSAIRLLSSDCWDQTDDA